MNISADLELAHQLADAADARTLDAFRSDRFRVEHKSDQSPVTEIDRGVEAALREILRSRRPGDGVLGEEAGESGQGERRWIIDPIDATRNFIRGVPVFATLVALEVEGEPVLGMASAPALGRRWWATREAGAHSDTGPIAVSTVSALGEAFLVHADLEGWREHGRLEQFLDLAEACARTRGFGDFYMHMLVAEGSAEVAAEPEVDVWDVAAIKVIVEEAGGTFSDLSGALSPRGGSAVSTNGRLHRPTLNLLSPGVIRPG